MATIDGFAPVPALPIFQRIVKSDGAEVQEKFAKQAKVQKEIEYFREKVKELKEPEDLFKDRRLMQFVLSAYSMDDELQYMGRMKKILLSKLDDEESLAQRMIDPRFREINKDLAMGDFGVAVLKTSSQVETLVSRYITNEYEKDLGNQNSALREASYFLRKIGSVTSSLEILGDKVLRSVVTYTLGLPDQIALQSVQKQQSLIDARLDISKFALGGSSSSTKITSDKAKADVTALDAKLALVSKTATQVQTMLDRMQDIKDDYDRLANIQNPGGPYAPEIPVQEAAVPELVRMRGLMGAAAAATGTLEGVAQRMNELITLASDPANAGSLAAYKTEFETLRQNAHTAVNNADYVFDDTDPDATGTAQNMLDGSLAGPISVQINSSGTTIQLRTHDLGGALNSIDDAAAAFQAVTGAGDAANLAAAQSDANSFRDAFVAAKSDMLADEADFITAIGNVGQFAASLNTDEITQGFQSASDAATRSAKIVGLLSQIRAVANESALRGVGDDRSDLETRYDDLVSQVSTEINTAGAGLDNFLAGGSQSYEIINSSYLSVRGRDLNASIMTALNAGDISTAGGASAVMSAFSSTIDPAIQQTQRELGADMAGLNLVVGTFDARAPVDAAYRKLAADMATLVKDAGVDTKDSTGKVTGTTNLLSATQPDLSLKVETTGNTITIKGRRTFDADVTQVIAAGAALLPSTAGDTSGALAKLNEAMFNARRVLSSLNSDARALDLDRTLAKAAGTAADAEAAKGANGIDATDFTLKFITRFLAKKDVEANSANNTATMASLIYPINRNGGGRGGGVSIVQVGAGMNFFV